MSIAGRDVILSAEALGARRKLAVFLGLTFAISFAIQGLIMWRGGPIAPKFDIPEVLPTLTSRAEKIIRERSGKATRLRERRTDQGAAQS